MKELFDPSLNFFYRKQSQLDKIFAPKSVAVIGATENPGSVGLTLMNNLLATRFGGDVYPVNPKRPSVLGIKAYPSIAEVPVVVDLAVIVTPAKAVPQIISECADRGVPAAIIISAGFKEMGAPGVELESQILMSARKGKMRIIGPNCLGVMSPTTGLNATFAAGMALKGHIAFISQSGALCTAVLDWSLREKVGFSAFVSIGSSVDVGWGDLITYFGSDEATQSILIYMESIGDTRAFLSAAREVALSKPIILIKAGKSEESAKAAASHTGSMAGSDEALSAALWRIGVLRVDSIADLFSMADLLGKQPRPRGPHLTIVTNAGGPGVIATDALIEAGGKLTELSSESMAAYDALLPPHWSHNNPVDILGDAGAETYAKAVDIAMKDPHSDGVLVILTPQDMTDPTGTAEKLRPFAHKGKPILASWMGADSVLKGESILSSYGIPTFEFPDMACKAFAMMWNSFSNLRGIYELPQLSHDSSDEKECSVKTHRVHEIFEQVRKENRTILDEYESKKVLEAYGIPTVPTEIAKNSNEAVKLAKSMGFPIVLKLYSKTITHKSDVGGVKLNLSNEAAVKQAFDEIQSSVKKIAGADHFQGVTVQPMIKLEGYELILGSTTDPQFGPLMLFGLGGQLVEIFKDRSLAIPPLTSTLARLMMERTKIYSALLGVRGRAPIDLKKLERVLVEFSTMIVEEPWIKECDINPLLASPDKLIALDARIILHDPNLSIEELPKSAIRPYPSQYIELWKLKDQTPVTLRPIRPDDEPMILQFHKDLSEESVRQRYLKAVDRKFWTSHENLSRVCFVDYDREISLVVERKDPKGHRDILGIGRLTKVPGTADATFGLAVKDLWQHQGIGLKLMQKLLQVAKDEKIERISARMLPENFQMKKLCSRLGFALSEEEGLVVLTKSL